MTRILAGEGRGRRLKAPRGQDTRPTGARVRQSLFDVLAPLVPGARVLDAFAGSGGVGLEALSRGAARVVLVDRSGPAVEAVRENLRALAPGGQAEVFRQDALVAIRALGAAGESFDLVYLDPPYDSGLYEPALDLLDRTGVLAEDGLAVAEHFHKRALPERIGRLVRIRSLRIGDHRLTFYRRQPGAAPGEEAE